MTTFLQGQKILLIAPRFFGYEQEIRHKLERMGAEVTYFDERPKNNFIVKASVRINKKLVKRQIGKYFENILNSLRPDEFDIVLIVNIEAMLPSVLEALRQQQSRARFILYMWDSIQNKKKTLDFLPFFNSVFSFDKTDAEKIQGVNFRPLFFIDKYASLRTNGKPSKTDLCFIGTVHSDRYNLINSIRKQGEQLGLKCFFFMYFPSKLLFYYKKIRDIRFYKARFSEFRFNPLAQQDIVEHIADARAVLDFQHPGQTGLTMRTIEMLGAGKKVITTNPNIREYDFYHPHNVYILDRDNPVLDLSFFQLPMQKRDDTLLFKYSLEGWITEILQ